MGVKSIKSDWKNINLSDEEARLLIGIERNPVYRDVVVTYRNRRAEDDASCEPLTFGDICYWLEYEAGYQENEENDHRFSPQAIASIKKWVHKYYAYPVHPWGWY